VKGIDPGTGKKIIHGMPIAGMYYNNTQDSTRCRADGLGTSACSGVATYS
jgi:hypothetical protein